MSLNGLVRRISRLEKAIGEAACAVCHDRPSIAIDWLGEPETRAPDSVCPGCGRTPVIRIKIGERPDGPQRQDVSP
jgi:hypothetical protein